MEDDIGFDSLLKNPPKKKKVEKPKPKVVEKKPTKEEKKEKKEKNNNDDDKDSPEFPSKKKEEEETQTSSVSKIETVRFYGYVIESPELYDALGGGYLSERRSRREFFTRRRCRTMTRRVIARY